MSGSFWGTTGSLFKAAAYFCSLRRQVMSPPSWEIAREADGECKCLGAIRIQSWTQVFCKMAMGQNPGT
jgi:hypothetical protein